MGRIIICDDIEPFTLSDCTCDFCLDMHRRAIEWESFVPETVLQRNMMRVVKRIEKREVIDSRPTKRAKITFNCSDSKAERTKGNSSEIRRSPRLNPVQTLPEIQSITL